MAVLRRVEFAEAYTIAEEHGIVPCVFLTDYDRGRGVLRFAKPATIERDARFVPLDLTQFEAEAKKRGVVVFDADGWLKIMRDPDLPPCLHRLLCECPDPASPQGHYKHRCGMMVCPVVCPPEV